MKIRGIIQVTSRGMVWGFLAIQLSTIYYYGKKLVKIGIAAKMLGTTPGILRKREGTGGIFW